MWGKMVARPTTITLQSKIHMQTSSRHSPQSPQNSKQKPKCITTLTQVPIPNPVPILPLSAEPSSRCTPSNPDHRSSPTSFLLLDHIPFSKLELGTLPLQESASKPPVAAACRSQSSAVLPVYPPAYRISSNHASLSELSEHKRYSCTPSKFSRNYAPESS